MKAKIIILMSLFLCMFIPIFAQEEVVLIQDETLFNDTIEENADNLTNETQINTTEKEEESDKFFMNFSLVQLVIFLIIALIILTILWKLVKFAFKIGLIIVIIIIILWIIQKII